MSTEGRINSSIERLEEEVEDDDLAVMVVDVVDWECESVGIAGESSSGSSSVRSGRPRGNLRVDNRWGAEDCLDRGV